MGRAGRGRSDSGGAREGRVLLDARGQALHRFQQPADVRQHRPWRPARRQRDSASGRGADVRDTGDGHRAARAAWREAGRADPWRHRRLLLHQRRCRGQRERVQDRARLYRPTEDSGAVPLVSWRHRSSHRRHRRTEKLEPGRVAGDRPCARPVSRDRARVGIGGERSALSRRGDPARRSAHDRRVHPRVGNRDQRHPRFRPTATCRACARSATSTASS